MQYAGHNTQDFIPDQVGNLESTRLGKAQGSKLVLSLNPIAHLFGLICHTHSSFCSQCQYEWAIYRKEMDRYLLKSQHTQVGTNHH